MSSGRSGKRLSINEIVLPPDYVKKLSGETLKTLSSQDEATFYEFFQGLELEDVSELVQGYACPVSMVNALGKQLTWFNIGQQKGGENIVCTKFMPSSPLFSYI